MSARKIIANVVGLAGSVAIGWGVHGLTLTGNCGTKYGDHPCPPESTAYFVALFAGLAVTIGAFRFGGRLALLFLFAGAATGSIWAGAELPPDDRTGPTVVVVLVVAAALVPVALIVVGMWRGRWKAKLVAGGATAIGSVTAIHDTGTTVGKNPQVRLAMRIEPLDGAAAFDGEKTIVARRVDLPYQGQRFPVWFDPADHSRFVMIMKVNARSSPQVHRLFELAKARDPGRPAGPGIDEGDA